jgi:hypothetical protein
LALQAFRVDDNGAPEEGSHDPGDPDLRLRLTRAIAHPVARRRAIALATLRSSGSGSIVMTAR